MTIIPYIVTLPKVVTASSTARLFYQVSNDETLEITNILQKSTGAFDIYGISDSRGTIYSSAAAGNTMDGDFIADIATAFNGIYALPSPIVLAGGTIIYIDVLDTSAAQNTVEIILMGRRLLGSDK